MSKGLEKIVASLELCKLIPAGEFEDTALVWLAQTMTTHAAGLKAVEHFGIRFGKSVNESAIMDHEDEFGAIVGRVDLIDCGRSQSVWAQQDVKYHWTVRHGQHIVPVPMRGQLGLFRIQNPEIKVR